MRRKKPQQLPPDVRRHIHAILNSTGWATMTPIAKGICVGCSGRSTGPDDDWICAQCPLAGIAYIVAVADRHPLKQNEEGTK